MNKTILSLDDDHSFSKLLEVMLSKHSFDVIATDDPKSFVYILKDEKTNVDLCLIDVNLHETPGAGFKLVQAIRNKLGDDLPLFIVSRRSSEEDIAYAFDIGANDYIQKPVDEKILLSKINAFLLNSSELDEGFHYKEVQEKDAPFKLLIDFKLLFIAETGIKISCKEHISKGTLINISNDILTKATSQDGPYEFYVSSTNYIAENENHIFLEFSNMTDSLRSALRKWILTNIGQEEKIAKSSSIGDPKSKILTVDNNIVDIDEDILELMPEYLKLRGEDIVKLEQAIQEDDFKTLQSIAHMIAGNAGSFCLNELGDFAKKLELEAEHDKDINLCTNLVHSMKSYLNSIELK